MVLFSILRFIAALLSIALLAWAGYLLWSWYDGELVSDAAGNAERLREDWRLWLGLALLAFSLLGKMPLALLLGRPDEGEPTHPVRENGSLVAGPGGKNIYIEGVGPETAPVIVLTHGAGLDSTIWYYAKRDLTKNFRLVTWDLPGLGRSEANEITLEHYAEALAAVIRLAGPRKVVLVGHSMGGMIIQTLARRSPALIEERAAGIVLLNTTHTNPLKTMILPRLAQALRPLLEIGFRLQAALQPLAWIMSWQSYLNGSAHLVNRLGFGARPTRSQLNHAALLGTRNPPASIARGNLAMFNWDATGALAKVTVPVLVIAGSIDIVTKEEASRTIAASSPSAQLKIMEGANHFGFLEQAGAYNQAIAEFTRSVQVEGPSEQGHSAF